MKRAKERGITRRGFTIIELLVVISVMAIIATLATSAALKSLKQGRRKKVVAMISTLEMALMNYRAQENEWSFTLSALDEETDGEYWARGAKNMVVFKELLISKTRYLDASALYTAVRGRMTVKQALEKGITDIAIGYPDPDNPNIFKYFSVKYSPLTDRVKVYE